MIMPTENVEKFFKEHDIAFAESIKELKSKYSDWDIIRYELSNHECFYTGNIEDAAEVLADYGYSYDHVKTVFLGRKLLGREGKYID